MKDEIIELISKKKYKSLYDLLDVMNEVDISALMTELNQEELVKVFRLLSKDKAVDVFAEMDPDDQEKLIESLTDNELQKVISEMYLDDTVDLISEMPSTVVKRILRATTPDHRREINELLKYPEDSAGSIMTTEFVELHSDMTVRDAIDDIRREAIDKETVYTCYVLDATRHLQGIVTVKDLLISDYDVVIRDIMEENIISAKTLDDQEEVAKLFDKYNFLALPVVDSENRLVGIVTVDDAIDVLQEENAEDFELMGAVIPNDETYFKTSVFKHALHRLPWLALLMISAIISGFILQKYETVFAAFPLLVILLTNITDTGGNSGTQSSTLIIRGLATDEITLKDYLRVVWKEFRIGLVCSVVLAIVNGLRVYLQYKNSAEANYAQTALPVAIIVALTMVCVVIVAKLLGASLPMLAKLVHLDPAIMATPFLTTLVDAVAVLLYFAIAARVLTVFFPAAVLG
ncbi:MAG: magnesium transporter [Clostridia bacterium]|nr:magnesium transporter [Clostridia bacterium]